MLENLKNELAKKGYTQFSKYRTIKGLYDAVADHFNHCDKDSKDYENYNNVLLDIEDAYPNI